MVKVYAIAMCYNEIDIIEEFISHVHRQDFDGLILLDHFSNDGTQMQLVKLQDELKADKTFDFQIFYTRNRSFDKVNKINGMAAYAHFVAHSGKKGDTWIVPMDCDEFWQTDSNTPLAVKLKEEEAFFYNCFYNHMRNYMNTAVGYDKYYLAPSDKRQQLRNEKCCFIWDEDIWATSGYHNLMSKKRGAIRVNRATWLIIKHYPYRSLGQVKKKYRNLREAILLQKNRDPLADRHSVERGGMNDKQILEWYKNNCYVEEPEKDPHLIKEA